MARARNIKPGFFKNELLVELGPFERLLFIGLWCLSDREGRVEDRPKRIKMELFPCDSYDVDSGLDELSKANFIARYEANGVKVITIHNFTKHQTPHGTEKDSDLPDVDGCLTINERTSGGYVTGKKRKNNVNSNKNNVHSALDNSAITVNPPLDNALNPDSLNPDSLNPEYLREQDKPAKQAKRRSQISDNFYPNESGLDAIQKTSLSLAIELTSFTNHHKAKGSLMADWQAAWRTWVANGVRYAKTSRPAESFAERDERNARDRFERATGRNKPIDFVEEIGALQ